MTTEEFVEDILSAVPLYFMTNRPLPEYKMPDEGCSMNEMMEKVAEKHRTWS